jgi:hypothetical protein
MTPMTGQWHGRDCQPDSEARGLIAREGCATEMLLLQPCSLRRRETKARCAESFPFGHGEPDRRPQTSATPFQATSKPLFSPLPFLNDSFTVTQKFATGLPLEPQLSVLSCVTDQDDLG